MHIDLHMHIAYIFILYINTVYICMCIYIYLPIDFSVILDLKTSEQTKPRLLGGWEVRTWNHYEH